MGTCIGPTCLGELNRSSHAEFRQSLQQITSRKKKAKTSFLLLSLSGYRNHQCHYAQKWMVDIKWIKWTHWQFFEGFCLIIFCQGYLKYLFIYFAGLVGIFVCLFLPFFFNTSSHFVYILRFLLLWFYGISVCENVCAFASMSVSWGFSYGLLFFYLFVCFVQFRFVFNLSFFSIF